MIKPIGTVVCLFFMSLNVTAQSQLPSKDSLVVSFISIGAGTDYKAKEKLDSFVKEFQRTHQITLDVNVRHWGREGETDYIYDLTKLSRRQCKAFVEEMEALFSKNNLVKISHGAMD